MKMKEFGLGRVPAFLFCSKKYIKLKEFGSLGSATDTLLRYEATCLFVSPFMTRFNVQEFKRNSIRIFFRF